MQELIKPRGYFAAIGNDCDNPGTSLTVAQLCSTVQSLQALSSQQTTFAENKSDVSFEGTYAINTEKQTLPLVTDLQVKIKWLKLILMQLFLV